MAETPLTHPVVFPLFGIKDGKCACGNENCGRVGKHPRVAWGELEYGTPVPRPEPGAGAGLKTGAAPKGSGVFVVDLDSVEAVDAWLALGDCPDTFTVTTPRGFHLYFEHPGFHVKTCAGELGKGIDIRGDGGFVVAPGSPHRSGGTYEACEVRPPSPAPAWLLDWLKRQPAQTEAQVYPGDVEGPEREYHRRLYADYLRDEAPARGADRRGQGDAILFNVVQRGAYDLALPVDDVLELVREHYDPRCEPPWGDELEERVHHKARCAKEESTRPRIVPLPEDLAHLAGGVEEMPDFSAMWEEKKTDATPKGSMGETWGGWSKPLEPPSYLLEDLIPEGKVVTFFAEGGSVKTWSALALAIAVATGEPWLGKYPVKKGKVLYLDYEDGPYEVSRRVRKLTGGQDVPDLGYLYGGPQLDQKEKLWNTLAKKVVDEGISFVVADSLGAGMPGNADENTTAFAAGMKIAGKFTEAGKGCTVLFVHHANKNGGMRGTSAARDQSDVVFKFEPVSETDSVKRMRMVCDKPGPQKRPKPVNVELTDDGLRTFEDEAADAIRNTDTGKPKDLKEAIKLALRNGPLLLTKLKGMFPVHDRKVIASVKELTEAGEVVVLDKRKGVQLDSEAARRERMFETARTFMGSKSGLAAKASVLLQDVEAAFDSGELVTSGSGFVVHEES